MSVDYALPNGGTARAENVYPLHSTAATVTMGLSDWYVVTGEVTTAAIEVCDNAEANLILADGAKLTANGGVGVNAGTTLNIYCQSAGTGELIAMGCKNAAGIGGTNPRFWAGFGTCGTVTINGGTVVANGEIVGAAGIGAGKGGSGEGNWILKDVAIVEGGLGTNYVHAKVSAYYRRVFEAPHLEIDNVSTGVVDGLTLTVENGLESRVKFKVKKGEEDDYELVGVPAVSCRRPGPVLTRSVEKVSSFILSSYRYGSCTSTNSMRIGSSV